MIANSIPGGTKFESVLVPARISTVENKVQEIVGICRECLTACTPQGPFLTVACDSWENVNVCKCDARA